MKYEAFDWKQVGTLIVYGGSNEDRDAFIRAFRKTHAEYRTEVFDLSATIKKVFCSDTAPLWMF